MSELRYVAKKNGEGRSATWRVYDRLRGSYPFQVPVLGKVAQDHKTEAEAEAEARRCTELGGYMPVKGKGRPAEPKKSAVPDPDEAEETDEDDAEDQVDSDDD